MVFCETIEAWEKRLIWLVKNRVCVCPIEIEPQTVHKCANNYPATLLIREPGGDLIITFHKVWLLTLVHRLGDSRDLLPAQNGHHVLKSAHSAISNQLISWLVDWIAPRLLLIKLLLSAIYWIEQCECLKHLARIYIFAAHLDSKYRKLSENPSRSPKRIEVWGGCHDESDLVTADPMSLGFPGSIQDRRITTIPTQPDSYVNNVIEIALHCYADGPVT